MREPLSEITLGRDKKWKGDEVNVPSEMEARQGGEQVT